MRRLIVFLILCVFVFVGGLGVVALTFIYSRPSDTPETIVFEVQPGSMTKVAEQLHQTGLITDSQKFIYLARFTGNLKKIRIGEYEMNTAMLPYEVLNVLTSGKSIVHSVTFPEGTNRFEMAEILQKAGLATAAEFLEMTQDRQLIKDLLGDSTITSLEGYLFPDTYGFTKYSGTRTIIKVMVDRFNSVYNQLAAQFAKSPSAQIFKKHELVTLASMVEKETGAPTERPMIASVFYNRLKVKMKLQSDPTTMYGILESTLKPVSNITKDMLLTPTKYNTYTVPALPYGPIANPGRESMVAVLQPATSDYLFFVSHNDGTHAFSRTLAEHTSSVKKFQVDPKAREGKSWRDLNKKKQVKN